MALTGPTLSATLHVRSGGRLSVLDLNHLIAAALNDAGVATTIAADRLPVLGDGHDGHIDIIVSPDDALLGDPSIDDERRVELASRCILIGTEQPESDTWESHGVLMGASPLAFAINEPAVAVLVNGGIPTHRFRLGYHRSLDCWGGPAARSDTSRDLGVVVIGRATPRRLRLLAQSSAVLSHRPTRLLLHDPLIPVQPALPGYVSGPAKAELLGHTKLLMNIHDLDHASFDWMRAIEAISNGALLITEPSVDSEPFEPFDHYIAADPDLFSAHITELLVDEPRRARLAAAAYEVLRADIDMTDYVRSEIVPMLEDHAGRTSTVGSTTPGTTEPDRASLDLDLSIPEPDDSLSPELIDARARLFASIIESRDLRRALTRAELQLAGDDPDRIEDVSTPAWDCVQDTADVSVIVPLYNYEHDVTRALDSVFASRRVRPEVIVVDDGSTDGSAGVLRAYMEAHPDRPVLGMFRAVNAGVSAARNLGRSRARSSRLFLLDADNELFPDGLAKLGAALDETDSRLVYGILEMYGDYTHLVSAMAWNVESLILRPYIDNMAMVEADLLDEVGGFPDNTIGLEDYEFYLDLAERGEAPLGVPEIIGRYQVHRTTSLGAVAALDLPTVLEGLRSRHPRLPWPQEQP